LSRYTEATGVNANDLQLERGHPQVLLRGKGRRDCVVPIPQDLLRSVTALLSERGVAHHEPRPIFVGAHNERLTRFRAIHIVRRAVSQAVFYCGGGIQPWPAQAGVWAPPPHNLVRHIMVTLRAT